jgi:hypothetical protein
MVNSQYGRLPSETRRELERQRAQVRETVEDAQRYLANLDEVLERDTRARQADAEPAAGGTTQPEQKPGGAMRFGQPIPAGASVRQEILDFFREADRAHPGAAVLDTALVAALPHRNADSVTRMRRTLTVDKVLERRGKAFILTSATPGPAGEQVDPVGRPDAPTDLGEARRARSA